MTSFLTNYNYPSTCIKSIDLINNFQQTNNDLFVLSDLSSLLSYSVDPAIMYNNQANQDNKNVTKKYVNHNGIDIKITGSNENVKAVIDVLTMYPPNKSMTNMSRNVPKVGIIKSGQHVQIKMDNKNYTGSGSLIMIAEKNKGIYFMMFKDPKTKECQELGGRIDEPKDNIDETILFKNASKESQEESMNMIKINKPSKHYIDILSSTNNTYYRCYLYFIVVNNIEQIKTLYNKNKTQLMENYINNFDESFYELDQMILFEYNLFIKKLKTYKVETYESSFGIFQSQNGTNEIVRSRTLQTISKFVTNGTIDKIIHDNEINKSVIEQSNSFNKITIE